MAGASVEDCLKAVYQLETSQKAATIQNLDRLPDVRISTCPQPQTATVSARI
jgi:hypothetical protein